MTRPELPEYTVRRSARARRIRLSVSPHHGLVVVVPDRWRGDPDEIVAGKRDWAERALARVADRRAELTSGAEALLPSEVPLRAFGETWPVEYRASAAKSCSAFFGDGVIVVSGAIDDADACLAALRRWLARTAAERLPLLLGELAHAHGLTPTKVRVGGARTRWGSCSGRGTVSLNRNLVFLPSHLVDALILHELAHLRVMDHSPRFWSLLGLMDPDALDNRAQLRDAGRFVPGWADV